MTDSPLFPVLSPSRPSIEWRRYAKVVGANYEIIADGVDTGTFVCHCGHPTALRPYYVQMADGRILDRKFHRLTVAKAAAIEAFNATKE